MDGDGLVVHELKRPFRDGTTRLLFEPRDFLARLAALVPRPRRRVFDIDLRVCPHCGGSLRVLAVVTEPSVIAAILGHIERSRARAPPPTSS